jgi:hypothetical protein
MHLNPSFEEDRRMRLSTIDNWKFWPAWLVLLAAVIGGFLFGLEGHGSVIRALAVGGFIVGLVALTLTAGLRQQARSGARRSPASLRYLRRFLSAMMAYAVILITALWLKENMAPTGLLAYALAVSPALPLLVAIWAIGRYMVEEDDEFQRKVMVESYLLASGATLAICTVVGFLQTFELIPAIPLWTVFPLMAACLGPAQGWLRWKYR